VVIASPWSAPPENLRNMRFWRSRIEYYSPSDERQQACINWNAVMGIMITFGISAGFWAGMGFAIAHIWK
jgi:hypothetical protein